VPDLRDRPVHLVQKGPRVPLDLKGLLVQKGLRVLLDLKGLLEP
jgi:hypothetical protein